MNAILFCTALLIALSAWILNTHVDTLPYACAEVSKQDPIEVQKLCAQAKRNRSWMK
jgi:hypothetical protein